MLSSCADRFMNNQDFMQKVDENIGQILDGSFRFDPDDILRCAVNKALINIDFTSKV